MPDWQAWPFPTEDPYPAYRLARARAPVQWNEQLGAHLVLSYEHAAAVLRSPEWSSDPRNSSQLLASLGGPRTCLRAVDQVVADERPTDPHAPAQRRQSLLHPPRDGAHPRAYRRDRRGRVRTARRRRADRADERARLPDTAGGDRGAIRCRPRGSRAAARGDADARADARARPDARGAREDRRRGDDGDAVPRPDRRRAPARSGRGPVERADPSPRAVGRPWRPTRSSRCAYCCSPPVTRRPRT